LSEHFTVMRPSLVPGLCASLVYNRNRQAADIRLFELGSIFSSTSGERTAVGWVMTGSRSTHWSDPGDPIDFSDTRGVAELIAAALGSAIAVDTPDDDLPWLARGERATVLVGDRRAGWIGRLAAGGPTEPPVYAGELDLDVLGNAAVKGVRTIRPLPRY